MHSVILNYSGRTAISLQGHIFFFGKETCKTGAAACWKTVRFTTKKFFIYQLMHNRVALKEY
jgi:hypothetical protein